MWLRVLYSSNIYLENTVVLKKVDPKKIANRQILRPKGILRNRRNYMNLMRFVFEEVMPGA